MGMNLDEKRLRRGGEYACQDGHLEASSHDKQRGLVEVAYWRDGFGSTGSRRTYLMLKGEFRGPADGSTPIYSDSEWHSHDKEDVHIWWKKEKALNSGVEGVSAMPSSSNREVLTAESAPLHLLHRFQSNAILLPCKSLELTKVCLTPSASDSPLWKFGSGHSKPIHTLTYLHVSTFEDYPFFSIHVLNTTLIRPLSTHNFFSIALEKQL
ncbi:hypothetical protein QQP08_001331 [Theobroma cacao]|nr:hypothetical protein QQP08_001331 [Theobroma cacao]